MRLSRSNLKRRRRSFGARRAGGANWFVRFVVLAALILVCFLLYVLLKPLLFGDERAAALKRGTENAEAHELYLRGRFSWNQRTAEAVRRAADYYQEAIAKDPRYALAHAGLAECYVLYNGWKYLSDYNLAAGSEDNIQYATADGTPAWYTLNVRAAYAFSRLLSGQVGLENIEDVHYRTFASGVSAPGRNLQVSLRVQW